MLVAPTWCPTLMFKDRECWWQKLPKPSPTSQSCHQLISSPTSVPNIDVTFQTVRKNAFDPPSNHSHWTKSFFSNELKSHDDHKRFEIFPYSKVDQKLNPRVSLKSKMTIKKCFKRISQSERFITCQNVSIIIKMPVIVYGHRLWLIDDLYMRLKFEFQSGEVWVPIRTTSYPERTCSGRSCS